MDDLANLIGLQSHGRCINHTGEMLLVYGPKSNPPDGRDNAIYRLPTGFKTPDNWDCDGIFVPSDRGVIQFAFPDKQGPVAVKYGDPQTFPIEKEGDKYRLIVVNVAILAPAEFNWNIPTITHAQNTRFPDVPSPIPV